MAADRKVPYTINFTTRQIREIEAEARRLGVPNSDAVRRMVDEWIDRHPRNLQSKVYEAAR